MRGRLRWMACASLLALLFLCPVWELWLAPLQPGGTWLAAKGVPLLFIAVGIFRGRRYTYQVASLVALLYLLEGSVRVASDRGLTQQLAGLETLLALVFFFSVAFYARLSAPGRQKTDSSAAP
ncbi:MAG: DUF2069 domain-containing protein [Zoogloeaceae bacterium]|jgi:uncharacterized membrane protein|nr:DUF2069 domain-containing protein [Zoogloeaceae bacterium]